MPSQDTHNLSLTVHPRGVVYMILFMVLTVLAYVLIRGNLAMGAAITIMPIALFICILGMQYPMLSYIVYSAFVLYFSAIYRYTRIEGLSMIMPIFLGISIVSIMINIASGKKNDYKWENMFNIASVWQIFWAVFCILELLAPYTKLADPGRALYAIIIAPIPYLLSGVLLDNHKKLKMAFVLIGIFTITAAAKLYWQKTHGWDAAEIRFLMEKENWHTHILKDGVRYFSFFTDAGNFGATMGVFCTIYGLMTINLKNSLFRLFCLGVTGLAAVGMFMSGTRGAMVIPFGGIVIYILLSKSLKAFVTMLLGGIALFCFFYFTDIGNDNSFIRRARTAFRPNEDASFNVRLENQKLISYYLEDKPFGVGTGQQVADIKKLTPEKREFIPTDSYLIDIWVGNGIVGLCVYVFFLILILARGSYILLYKIRSPQLRKILAAILGGFFGLCINAYVGRGMGFLPCGLLMAVFLSFVLNGPYIEKNMPENYKF